MLINEYEEKKKIESSKIIRKKKNLELRKKLRITKMKVLRLANTMKDIYLIIILLQKRLLQAKRFLKIIKLKKVDENIMKQIKSFFREYVKVIYDIFKLINETYNFFE